MAKKITQSLVSTRLTSQMNKIRLVTPRKSELGFTLIEILVASVILFASLALISMIYRGAYLSSEKATRHVNISKVIPAVLSTIEYEIQQHSLTSSATKIMQESRAWDVHYKWQASIIESKAAPSRYDVDEGKFTTEPEKYKLWLVNLTLTSQGLTKEYSFKEVSWTSD
jgi:type II secretory pathway component PulJ